MARASQSLLQDVPHQHLNRLTAAVALAAVPAATMAWSGAMAAEAEIRPFPFGCETADRRIVKPRHGDIGGVTHTDLPAQRQQCLGTIDRKIALCRENIEFGSEAGNAEFADCLPIFRKQARHCVGHFSFERGKCGTDTPGPDEEAAAAQEQQDQAASGSGSSRSSV